jgi:dipeptidyl aminopeptidase/acylaminoacyl peptidase
MLKYFKAAVWIVLLAICFAVPTRAAEGPRKLEPTDLFNIEFPFDPQISPDGKRVVYARRFCDIMSDRRCSNLWIINSDGTGHRSLTTGNFNDFSARWSPDGTRLMYMSTRDGIPQIYIRWMDTGETTKLTNLTTAPSGIEWSPDGQSIAFMAFVPGAPRQIGSFPAPPAGAKWADPARVIDKLVYRWDRIGYLPPGWWQIFVVSADGGSPRQVTTGEVFYGFEGSTGGDPRWTPDGKYLIVSANCRPDAEYEPFDTEIYEISVADGAFKALTDRRGPDNGATVSPDGKLIAYMGYDEKNKIYQISRLYLMNRDGSGSRMISGALDRDVVSPRWAVDGSGVFFLYDDQGNTKVGFYTLDGKLKEVAKDIGGSGFTQSLMSQFGSFSLSKNGEYAVPYTRPEVPAEIAVGQVGGHASTPITHFNRELLGSKELGQVEQFWYPSSIDGRKIEGWIIKPPGFNPSKKYALMLEIHGGPSLNYGERFDLEKQLWAARDYVVLYTNPRGSTSYGEEFGNLIHHNYPGDDFYDLNSGVDAVIAKGYIDPDNLFVTGGSGGGVLTAWMIGRSTRFRAAAVLYPVINWYSWVLTADALVLGLKYWFPGLPWDNVEHYEKRSLLSVVKNVKTPTMVMTGEEDYRTPMSESEQYYEALKLLKVETVLVRFPGEGHGIIGRPSNHMNKVLFISNWFDQHRLHQQAGH